MSNLVELKRYTSKRGSTVVIVYQNCQRLTYHVGVVPGRYPSWLDWPIRYDDGSIAYDRPEVIPQYARPIVSRAFHYIDSLRPNYAIRFLVARLHVGLSDRAVLRDFYNRFSGANWLGHDKRADRHAIYRQALIAHHENQELYQFVMSGNH